jgi:hypothetical protein
MNGLIPRIVGDEGKWRKKGKKKEEEVNSDSPH